jgi:diguanylate cyclase (GGDEF)-like protein
MDVDNFKQINDTLGHSTGDDVLRSVVEGIQQYTRSMDVIARMGGDEFAFLLPETDQEATRQAVTRIHQGLAKKMLQNHWQVTFSIGVVTFIKIPETVDEMVKIADQAMYQVKNSTKNGISYYLVE